MDYPDTKQIYKSARITQACFTRSRESYWNCNKSLCYCASTKKLKSRRSWTLMIVSEMSLLVKHNPGHWHRLYDAEMMPVLIEYKCIENLSSASSPLFDSFAKGLQSSDCIWVAIVNYSTWTKSQENLIRASYGLSQQSSTKTWNFIKTVIMYLGRWDGSALISKCYELGWR